MRCLAVTFAATGPFALAAATASAQCSNVWVPGSGTGTVQTVVRSSVMWDPPGPAAPVLVVCGSFPLPTNPLVAMHVATYDPGTGALAPLGNWTNGGHGHLVTSNASGALYLAITDFTGSWIARWNGTGWTSIDGCDAVGAMAAAPNGDLYAGGMTTIGFTPIAGIARWNGTSWSQLGFGIVGYVDALALMPNGDVVAGGNLQAAGGTPVSGVARWNGSTWSPMGAGLAGWTLALHVCANGDVLAGGYGFPVSRWNGTTWSAVGASTFPPGSTVASLVELPDGDVLAGGLLAGGNANAVLRWDGVAWTTVAPSSGHLVQTMTRLPGDDVMVGGSYFATPLPGTDGMARLTTTCPSSVTATGAGCPGSGGANTMTAGPAWLGATWTAAGSALPAPAFVVGVTGLAPVQLPLANVLPQAAPGCTLRVSPDLLQVSLSLAGTAGSSLVVPSTAALVGAAFHHQLVALEFAPSLAIVAVSASNAVRVTIGAY